MDKRGNQAINCEVGDCMFNGKKTHCELTGITVVCPEKAESKTICKSFVKK